MMKKATLKLSYSLPFFLFFGSTVFHSKTTQASESKHILTTAPDSIGTEIVNGERYVIHRLSPQETYYQLGRIYNVPVKDIMQANNKKNLRVGDTIKIPRGKSTPVSGARPAAASPAPQGRPVAGAQQSIFTEYKVGKSETLYAISKRFDISIDEIKEANNLTSNTLREGQIIKIPNARVIEQPEPEAPQIPIIVEERQPIDDSEFSPNRYGIREKKERGIGTWMDSLGDGQTSLALHKTAPIGTILKITNPMNKSVAFAKVVGKFGDNQETQDAIVVLSKSVATALGLLDRRFQIELNYGVPLE